jgi:hypothetical protein
MGARRCTLVICEPFSVSSEGTTMAELPRTNDALLRALKIAAETKLTAEDLQRQRVSFIMGVVKDDSGITRVRVEEVLAEQGGKKASK